MKSRQEENECVFKSKMEMMSLMVVCLLAGKPVFFLSLPSLVSLVDVLSFILIDFTGRSIETISNDRTFEKRSDERTVLL